MRLLIITQKLDKEDENLGAFYYWFELFAKRVDELFIIAGGVGEVNLPTNATVLSMGKEKGKWKLHRIFKFLVSFAKYYRKSDVVLFHQIPEFVLAAYPIMLFRRKKTVLWYAHGSVTTRLRLAEKMVDYVFTSSAEGFRLPSKKVIYVGQAINTDIFKPQQDEIEMADDVINLVSVGRISQVKDYEILIRACKILKDTWQNQWTLSIVGGPLLQKDKEYLESLKSLTKDSSLSSYINFLGSHKYSEIPKLLREHDIFINVSKTGSLDKAVFEAMACGLTVITSNEAYRPILPSKYFLEHSSPEFLAERIKSLAQEPRPNMVLRNIVVDNHSLDKTIGRILSILRSKD